MSVARPCDESSAGAFVGHQLICEQAWGDLKRQISLSKRELQIAKRVFDDLNEEEIGRELGISRHTVHTHLERLYRKTGVNSRLQLVVFVVSHCAVICSQAMSIGCPQIDNREPRRADGRGLLD
jgi:DNA-binding CsgD family transcriptional regulator